MSERTPAQNVLANLGTLLPDLESVYKDIHSHPELSMQEKRTSGIAADRLRGAGYEVTTGVGKTGVVGVLRNGAGPAIMLRADNRLPGLRIALQFSKIASSELLPSYRIMRKPAPKLSAGRY